MFKSFLINLLNYLYKVNILETIRKIYYLYSIKKTNCSFGVYNCKF